MQKNSGVVSLSNAIDSKAVLSTNLEVFKIADECQAMLGLSILSENEKTEAAAEADFSKRSVQTYES
jgi:hypothetical protein